MATDQGKLTLLGRLDLSAAFKLVIMIFSQIVWLSRLELHLLSIVGSVRISLDDTCESNTMDPSPNFRRSSTAFRRALYLALCFCMYTLDVFRIAARHGFSILFFLLMQVFYTPNVRQYYMSESQTWNHHMTSYENDVSNNRVLSFRLKPVTLSDCLISISILFQTLGAATEKARDALFVRHLEVLSNFFWLDLRDLAYMDMQMICSYTIIV